MAHRSLQIYKELDPIATEAGKKHGATCKEGCAHCCYQLVMVTVPEALAIAEFLLASPFTVQTTLLKSIYGQLEVLSASDLTRANYFQKQAPCVFLKDNKCEIYDKRPSACRYHLVVSDPDNCAVNAENPVVSKIDLRSLEGYMWSEAARLSKQAGIPFSFAPLPVAISWALLYLTNGVQGFETAITKSDIAVMSRSHWLDLVVSETPLAQEILQNLEDNKTSG